MNVLEEYLVKIGAEVDANAFNGATRAINQLAGALKQLTTAFKVGGLLTALAKLFESVVSNIKAVADLDMQYQKLANSMWVTKGTAKELKMALDTMGASQEDVAWIPELREQFFRLREEMALLVTPEDADNQLLWIRQIGYDVQSLQIKLKMLREWIVYYLIKYLKPYIEEFQKFIKWINKQLGDNMPGIAKKLAKGLAQFMSVVIHAGRAVKDIGTYIWDFFRKLPEKVRSLVPVLAIAGAMIMRSPFGLVLTAIGGALVLLQDFYYYLDGKRSSKALAPMWKWLTDENNPLRKSLGAVSEAIGNIVTRITDFLGKVFTEDVRKEIVEAVEKIAVAVANIAKGIAEIISYFTKDNSKVNGFWDNFADGAERCLWRVAKVSKAFGKILNAMGLALQGNYKEAGAELSSAGFDIFTAFQGNDVLPNFGKFTPSSMKVSAGDNPDLDHLSSRMKSAEPYIGGMLKQMGIKDPEITSGYRDPARNAAAGGVWNSRHLSGEAMDIYIGNPGKAQRELIERRFRKYFGEVLFHDVGNGAHLHLADYKGGMEGIAGYSGMNINPNSYAANTPMAVDIPRLVNGNGVPTNYSNTSQRFGNISITINGVDDPKANAAAVMDIFNNPMPYLNANRSIGGGVGD